MAQPVRPLSDGAGLSWLDSQSDRLAELRAHTLDALHETGLAPGGQALLVAELENLSRERLHRHPITRYRAGRRATGAEGPTQCTGSVTACGPRGTNRAPVRS